MEAALRLNGASESYDWSRQAEDLQYGRRLMAAGYKMSIHRNFFAKELIHKDKPGQFKPGIHCNPSLLFFELEKKSGEDFIKSNHRKFTDLEISLLRPCCYLAFEDGRSVCKGSGRNQDCEWSPPGQPSTNMTHPDVEIFLRDLPVFNLAEERQKKLAIKEKYRVL
jgi:hypothetical protein